MFQCLLTDNRFSRLGVRYKLCCRLVVWGRIVGPNSIVCETV